MQGDQRVHRLRPRKQQFHPWSCEISRSGWTTEPKSICDACLSSDGRYPDMTGGGLPSVGPAELCESLSVAVSVFRSTSSWSNATRPPRAWLALFPWVCYYVTATRHTVIPCGLDGHWSIVVVTGAELFFNLLQEVSNSGRKRNGRVAAIPQIR